MSFESLARLLLPPAASEGGAGASEGGAGAKDGGADQSKGGLGGEEGLVVEADERWALGRALAHEGAPVVWGREPTYEPAGSQLLRYARDRERALARLRRRPPAPLRVAAVHRWPQRFYRARLLPGLMARLREGVVVELAADDTPPRVLDLAARAAGAVGPVIEFHIGAGGSATAPITAADGSPRMLRTALAGSPADPAPSARALERLAPLGLACVPVPAGRGSAASASWSAESMLSGRPPRRLGGELVAEVARFCLALPRGSGPPLAFEEEMRALIEQLPRFSAELSELLARTQPIVASLPSVTRHGDLWGGNLLTEGDRLTGVIDWDAWHPSAVPATDLLHLVASARALATGRSLAEIWLERPWLAGSFREAADGYWQALEVEPREGVLEAVGVAWWAGRTAHDLARHPHHAGREDWLSRNVEPLLEGASLARRATSH